MKFTQTPLIMRQPEEEEDEVWAGSEETRVKDNKHYWFLVKETRMYVLVYRIILSFSFRPRIVSVTNWQEALGLLWNLKYTLHTALMAFKL